MIWWEKTVEYAFVLRFMSTSERFLAPLAGTHERAGDAIFAMHTNFVLIEFKRDRKDLKSEEGKFVDYSLAKSALIKKDGHHLLIYGVGQKKKLNLHAQTYFRATKVDLRVLVKRGVPLDVFKNYLKLFLYHKGKGGDGGVAAELEDLPDDPGGLDYMVVTGIVEGQPSFVMSLKDFLSSFKKPDGGATGTVPITPRSPHSLALKQKAQQVAMLTTHD